MINYSLILGRGRELQEKGIRIQSSTLNPNVQKEVFCLLQPDLMTILIREEKEKTLQWWKNNDAKFKIIPYLGRKTVWFCGRLN